MRQNVHVGLLDFGTSLLPAVTGIEDLSAWLPSFVNECFEVRDIVPGNLLSNVKVQKTVYHVDL